MFVKREMNGVIQRRRMGRGLKKLLSTATQATIRLRDASLSAYPDGLTTGLGHDRTFGHLHVRRAIHVHVRLPMWPILWLTCCLAFCITCRMFTRIAVLQSSIPFAARNGCSLYVEPRPGRCAALAWPRRMDIHWAC